MVENKIYVGWAFSENETEKMKQNRRIYEELIERYQVYRTNVNM